MRLYYNNPEKIRECLNNEWIRIFSQYALQIKGKDLTTPQKINQYLVTTLPNHIFKGVVPPIHFSQNPKEKEPKTPLNTDTTAVATEDLQS